MKRLLFILKMKYLVWVESWVDFRCGWIGRVSHFFQGFSIIVLIRLGVRIFFENVFIGVVFIEGVFCVVRRDEISSGGLVWLVFFKDCNWCCCDVCCWVWPIFSDRS